MWCETKRNRLTAWLYYTCICFPGSSCVQGMGHLGKDDPRSRILAAFCLVFCVRLTVAHTRVFSLTFHFFLSHIFPCQRKNMPFSQTCTHRQAHRSRGHVGRFLVEGCIVFWGLLFWCRARRIIIFMEKRKIITLSFACFALSQS